MTLDLIQVLSSIGIRFSLVKRQTITHFSYNSILLFFYLACFLKCSCISAIAWLVGLLATTPPSTKLSHSLKKTGAADVYLATFQTGSVHAQQCQWSSVCMKLVAHYLRLLNSLSKQLLKKTRGKRVSFLFTAVIITLARERERERENEHLRTNLLSIDYT